MGLPITRSKTLAASGATKVCASQTPLAGGNLLINGTAATGGVATLDTQRRVLFTFAADESARTFVVYGTNQSGSAIQETVTGNASTTYTNLDFLTVTRISIDAASAGAITVGTNGVGSGPWQSGNTFVPSVNINLQCVVTGTVNYTIQGTNMDVNNLPSGVAYPPVFNHEILAAQTASAQASWTDSVTMFRWLINSGPGTLQVTYDQAGISGP